MMMWTIWILLSVAVSFADAGCNEKYAVRQNEVVYITAPGYPGNFTQFADCYYELYTTAENQGLLVYVDVVDVTLSCDDDTTQLLVYDRFSRHPRFLGQICEGGQTTFESPKQTLYLTFRSRAQHAERSRGFRLRVRTEPKYRHCFTHETAVVDVGSTPGLITSPFYPYGTEANVNCRWLLKAPQGSRVNVSLLHSDMKGSSDCHNFGLYVYDGKTTYDDQLLGSVCDNSLQSFQSSGSCMLVVFTSGPMVYRSGGGVKLHYYLVTASDDADRQLIGQTLFFIITALLIVLIIVISLVAALKLFILPRRRKQAERRRRATRARLTRINRSQSEPQGGRHSSCSRASSSRTLSESGVSRQWSRLSLSRLLSLYGLKKSRQENRFPRSTRDGSRCLYDAQRSGVIIRVPGYTSCDMDSCFVSDLPPSYEEVIRQTTTENSNDEEPHATVPTTLLSILSGDSASTPLDCVSPEVTSSATNDRHHDSDLEDSAATNGQSSVGDELLTDENVFRPDSDGHSSCAQGQPPRVTNERVPAAAAVVVEAGDSDSPAQNHAEHGTSSAPVSHGSAAALNSVAQNTTDEAASSGDERPCVAEPDSSDCELRLSDM